MLRLEMDFYPNNDYVQQCAHDKDNKKQTKMLAGQVYTEIVIHPSWPSSCTFLDLEVFLDDRKLCTLNYLLGDLWNFYVSK